MLKPQKKQPKRKQRKDTKVPPPIVSTKKKKRGPPTPITNEATNEEHVPVHSNDPLLSGEDRLKLNELMELCTNLSQRVLDLDNIKTLPQAAEYYYIYKESQEAREENKSRTPSFKVKPKKPLKKKDQILVDEEIAQRLQEELQVELEEEERLARQKEEEVNLISWDNTQAMMEADYELAQRLQAEEQDSFVPIDTKVVKGSKSQAEGSSKRTGEELKSDNSKKRKIDENVEAEVDDEAEMKKHMEKFP
ncbi:hypothetical protein Tco_0597273 [Tanacetum coccineum]